jgi:hypothetical protein
MFIKDPTEELIRSYNAEINELKEALVKRKGGSTMKI